MESRYVPPHLRNKKETAKVVPVVEEVLPTETNFPTLGSGVSTTKVFDQPAGKSFANLASTWAKETEQKKQADELRKKYEDSQELNHRHPVVSLPRFHNVRHFVEPEDDEEDEETKPPVVNNEEDGWTEVRPKKKIRRSKTFEEKMARPPTPDENSKDDTVWNAEDEDSCWK